MASFARVTKERAPTSQECFVEATVLVGSVKFEI